MKRRKYTQCGLHMRAVQPGQRVFIDVAYSVSSRCELRLTSHDTRAHSPIMITVPRLEGQEGNTAQLSTAQNP